MKFNGFHEHKRLKITKYQSTAPFFTDNIEKFITVSNYITTLDLRLKECAKRLQKKDKDNEELMALLSISIAKQKQKSKKLIRQKQQSMKHNLNIRVMIKRLKKH